MEGCRHIVEKGRGRPVVFLHGWAVDGSFFAPQLALACESIRVIVPDLPGHGLDQRPGLRPTVESLASALNELLVRKALHDVVLVGWSMGALVALEHLRAQGSRQVSRLIVIDMTARVINDEGWHLGLASGLDLASADAAADRMTVDWNATSRRVAAALFAEGRRADPALLSYATVRILHNDAAVMAHLWRSLVRCDYRLSVRDIRLPALIIAGAASQLYRQEVSAWLAQALPSGRRVLIDGAGHAPHMEQPNDVNRLIAGFVAE
ncbi:MAG: alpha/beta hydrolase [Hyphomicrobiaceae bacterium]|nr:MAG: alpha/beta hydrolase [Hyphomicrobiaceae bacterium]